VVALLPPPEHAASATITTPPRARWRTARSPRCFEVVQVVWVIVSVGVVGGLFWLASRIEPHWCSGDGLSFTCRVQELDASGRPVSRWVEARAAIREGRVSIQRKVLIATARKVDTSTRRVVARSDAPPRGRAVFLLDGEPTMAMRVPVRSRAVARLDELVEVR
jgi:hypothetical protein